MSRELSAMFQREQLHRAAAKGDLQHVKELVERKYPVNRFDGIGKTPLHYAVVLRLLQDAAKKRPGI